AVLELQLRVRDLLVKSGGGGRSAAEIAEQLRADAEAVYHVLTHLAANDRRVRSTRGATPAKDQFSLA
ncbi:MAG TPA: glucose-6-phosphate isomerase, partial [Chthoniobacteraceae bacterium]|nr:glucose-6-phosphate isomerase [Chthoniobacteraceae bacterium]